MARVAGRSPGMRRLILPIALATTLLSAGSLAGASADTKPAATDTPDLVNTGGLPGVDSNRLITVIGHGDTIDAALDEAAADAHKIAGHIEVALGDVQSVTEQPCPIAPPSTPSAQTTQTTPGDASVVAPTCPQTVSVTYAIAVAPPEPAPTEKTPKGGVATDWTSVAPGGQSTGETTDDTSDGEAAADPDLQRLITVIGHGDTLDTTLDDAAAEAKQIADHEHLTLGDIETVTENADASVTVAYLIE
jgi:hypothetical protein